MKTWTLRPNNLGGFIKLMDWSSERDMQRTRGVAAIIRELHCELGRPYYNSKFSAIDPRQQANSPARNPGQKSRPEINKLKNLNLQFPVAGSIIQKDHIHPPVAATALFRFVCGDRKVFSHSQGCDTSRVHTKRHQRIHHLLSPLC